MIIMKIFYEQFSFYDYDNCFASTQKYPDKQIVQKKITLIG